MRVALGCRKVVQSGDVLQKLETKQRAKQRQLRSRDMKIGKQSTDGCELRFFNGVFFCTKLRLSASSIMY